MKNESVNVYAVTKNGLELLYKDIPEDIALEIWKAGLKTGKHKISIEWKDDEEFFKRQIESLHRH